MKNQFIRNITAVAVFALLLTSAHAQNRASIKFDKTRGEFGVVEKKSTPTVSVDFNFVNNGTSPLVIIKATPSCDCLSAEYPRNPIEVGGKGVVRIKVSTKGQNGDFSKTIILKTNTEKGVDILRVAGVVK